MRQRSFAIVFIIACLHGCGSSGHSGTTCGAPTTAATPADVQTIQVAAADGVMVTIDVYAPNSATSPVIVLFHQAGYSRGEYRTIAPRLTLLGFNAMAVDARAGEATQGVGNDTSASACALGKPTAYLDAIADVQAAVGEARARFQGALIVWGSSYSSSLVLALGHDLRADAVISFSPGEYFENEGKPSTWVAEQARSLSVPVFITSAKSEAGSWAPIAAAITPSLVTTFVPETAGHHGSSALWPTQPDADAYWAALTPFLQRFAAVR
ncbi:hypothetical protein BH11MYX2_BH11MYX2_28310 [soil metagenome]